MKLPTVSHVNPGRKGAQALLIAQSGPVRKYRIPCHTACKRHCQESADRNRYGQVPQLFVHHHHLAIRSMNSVSLLVDWNVKGKRPDTDDVASRAGGASPKVDRSRVEDIDGLFVPDSFTQRCVGEIGDRGLRMTDQSESEELDIMRNMLDE